MFPYFQNGVKSENQPKTWLFRTKFRFLPDPPARLWKSTFLGARNFKSTHYGRGVPKSKNSHFWVRGVSRPQIRSWFRKKYLEVRNTPGKGRKVDIPNLDFSIFANFRWFSVIFSGFLEYLQLQDLGARPRGCNNLEKIDFGRKWP